jgi:hypothetical protein
MALIAVETGSAPHLSFTPHKKPEMTKKKGTANLDRIFIPRYRYLKTSPLSA